ncbi:MAG: phosphoribosylglycinamide formyltransferase 2 [Candidatus Diapherotrites archaeon]|uniref:Formate-dependent phosphoribosylglycinamide formyltransferase n=1 Tax=Candidatus Iainarchaeum sp. TaxID=3101447 RepID=A0A2D6M188_9ARCH|nr:phosphoribosylglycinamide formyltransferase 2 [Candidatus Diapherotrites archaeon]
MKRKKLEQLTSPNAVNAKKLMLLGSGELGKEVVLEAKRLGFNVVAVDRYQGAPGQQVADKSYTGQMTDEGFLRSIVEKEKPDFIIPEIEAINLDLLTELEKEGFNVIPNARATRATMQRERIRDVIANEAGVKTSKYDYANSLDELKEVCEKIGYPCWVKALMSSSGHGSMFVKGPEDVEKAWGEATQHGRVKGERIIVEEHVEFDIEITELAVRHFDENGKIVTSFPKPIGHYQIDGDYHSSWQMAEVSEKAEKAIYEATGKITDALGGLGLFGCELFVKGDDVYANECSPRPHDTGMVTFVTHQLGFSQAGLHVRAITGLPVPAIEEGDIRKIPSLTPGASHVILSPSEGFDPMLGNVYNATNQLGVSLLFFGKPEAHVGRRMGVVLATADTVEDAKKKAEQVAHKIEMQTRQAAEWKKQQETRKHLLQK